MNTFFKLFFPFVIIIFTHKCLGQNYNNTNVKMSISSKKLNLNETSDTLFLEVEFTNLSNKKVQVLKFDDIGNSMENTFLPFVFQYEKQYFMKAQLIRPYPHWFITLNDYCPLKKGEKYKVNLAIKIAELLNEEYEPISEFGEFRFRLAFQDNYKKLFNSVSNLESNWLYFTYSKK